MSQSIISITGDLIFATKITSTARALDVATVTVRRMESLEARLEAHHDALVLIDLDTDDLDVIQAISACVAAAHAPRVVAYVSHIRHDLIDAADEAGAHEVVARSVFVTRLPELLQGAAKSR